MSNLSAYIAAACFGLCFSGMAWMVLRALASGAVEYSGTYTETTARQFEDIFLFIPPKRIAEAAWAGAATAFISVFFAVGDLTDPIGVFAGLALGGGAGFLTLKLPRILLTHLRARRLRKFNMQLIDGLAAMSSALKAGFSITQAFENVAKNSKNPISQEFHVFLHQTRVGMSFEDALHSMDKRVNSEDLTLVLMAIETARRTGGNLTEIFDNIAKTIRERLRIEGRIRTLTAMGRMQGMVLSAMPVVIGIAVTALRPDMMIPFIHSTSGVVIFGMAATMVILGGLVIQKIIRIDI